MVTQAKMHIRRVGAATTTRPFIWWTDYQVFPVPVRGSRPLLFLILGSRFPISRPAVNRPENSLLAVLTTTCNSCTLF
jgi:hypothetical protein